MSERREANIRNSIISGSLSGCLTAIIFQPFEFVKTKLQQPDLKNEIKISQNRKIRLIIHSTLVCKQTNKINFKNLGLFWNGVTPSLGRSVPVAGIYFGCIEYFKNSKVFNYNSENPNYQMINSFIIGSLSKTISDCATYPLNLIKTRYESDLYNYKDLRNAVASIVKKDGFFGLYKGLIATLIRDASYSGVYYLLYTRIKRLTAESGVFDPKSSYYFASCALISGIFASMFTQPQDVIRSRIQLDPSKYKSSLNAARLIYLKDGFNGFMRGVLPRSLRRVLISVMSWTLYEKITLK